MEAIGTATALVELLGLSIKVSKAANSPVKSFFFNAPKELVQLTVKLNRLYSCIEQFHGLGDKLPASDSFMLLPPEHQEMLSASLQTKYEALRTI
jgi:hypothetical protein